MVLMIFASSIPNVEKMREKKDVKGLIKALGDEKDSEVRGNAAQALGTIGDARAVEPLIRALGDSDWRVLWNAARALGKIGDPQAVEPLILLLRDPLIEGRDPVRKAIRRALEKLGSAPKD
jgi:HEAT repeat protein